MTGYTIRKANVNDSQGIHNMIHTAFSDDMPLISVGNFPRLTEMEKSKSIKKSIDGLTVVAESDDGKIVGIAINGVPKAEGESSSMPEQVKRFFQLVDKASQGLLFHKEETTMELRIMAVSREYRCKGIAKKLIAESENLAKSHGYSSIISICTGAFMEAAFRKKCWEPIFTYLYKDHAKFDPEFKVPPSPHDTLTIFEKKF